MTSEERRAQAIDSAARVIAAQRSCGGSGNSNDVINLAKVLDRYIVTGS